MQAKNYYTTMVTQILQQCNKDYEDEENLMQYVNKLNEDLIKLKNEIERQQQELSNKQAIQNENLQMTQEIQKNQQSRQQLQHKNELIQKNLQQIQEELLEYDKLIKINNEYVQEETKLQKSRNKLQKQEKEITNLKQKYDETINLKNRQTEKIQQLKKEIEELTNSTKEQEYRQQIEGLKNKHQSDYTLISKELDQLKVQLVKLKEQKNSQEFCTVEDLREKKQQLILRLKEMDEQLEDETDNKEAAEKKLQMLKSQIAQKQAELGKLTQN